MTQTIQSGKCFSTGNRPHDALRMASPKIWKCNACFRVRRWMADWNKGSEVKQTED